MIFITSFPDPIYFLVGSTPGPEFEGCDSGVLERFRV